MFKQYKNNFKLIYTAIYQIKGWDIEKKSTWNKLFVQIRKSILIKNLSFGDINKSFHIFEEI